MARILIAFLLICACPSEASQDYYGLLGVMARASQKDISVAFRKLSMKWHPDKNPGNREEAELRMRELSEAYSVLGKAESRQMYDFPQPKQPEKSWTQKSVTKTPTPSGSSNSWLFTQKQNQQGFVGFGHIWSLARLFGARQRQQRQTPLPPTARPETAQSFWHTWFLARLFGVRQHQQRPTPMPSKAQPKPAQAYFYPYIRLPSFFKV